MIEHDDHVGHAPNSYTESSPHSLLAAAAQRATRHAWQRNSVSREAADVERWEAEGGASASRPRLQMKAPQPRTMRAAMSTRPSYDSPHRSTLDTVGATAARASVEARAGKGPADGNEKLSKTLHLPRGSKAELPNKRQGRRTMGRHGNRP